MTNLSQSYQIYRKSKIYLPIYIYTILLLEFANFHPFIQFDKS